MIRQVISGAALQIVPKNIARQRSELEAVVLPLLRGHIFHVSGEAAFHEIARARRIEGKRQAQFISAFGSAEKSYGGKRGWVSLFDLSNPADAYIKEALISYYFFKGFLSTTSSIYLLFIAESAWSSLISWQYARREVGQRETYIPFVETWYPGDIPLDLVDQTVMVTVQPA